MNTHSHVRTLRRIAVTAVAATVTLTAAACSSDDAPSADGTTAMSVVLPWYASPESGGYFAAQTEGLYEEAGLDVTLLPGGPQVSPTQLVASGRAMVGHTDAAGIVQAQQEGIPIVAIGALFQDNPVGVLSHKDQGITSFEQMDGHNLVAYPGALYPMWVEKEYGISLPTVQSQGSIAGFLSDPELLHQGWPTNEVKKAEEAGVPVNFMPYSESGFNPYMDVLFTSKDYLESHRDELMSFLEASFTGWHDYMSDIEVATDANQAILAVNNEQSESSMWYAWDKQRAFIVAGDGAGQLGAMTAERWATLIEQLTEIDQIEGSVDVEGLYDTSLLPAVSAPTTLPAAPATPS